MAVSAEYLASVKKAIGIISASYDSDITDKIEEARAEMIRIGIKETSAVDETDALIRRAIVTFVHGNYPEDEVSAVRYFESAEKQMIMLSVDADYKTVVVEEVV